MAKATVQVNGEAHTFDQVTVLTMLSHLGLEPRLLVIERNGDILHRQEWEYTQVVPGDSFEIVTVVGGG